MLVVSMRVFVYLCVCVCRVFEGDVYFVVSVGGVCVSEEFDVISFYTGVLASKYNPSIWNLQYSYVRSHGISSLFYGL